MISPATSLSSRGGQLAPACCVSRGRRALYPIIGSGFLHRSGAAAALGFLHERRRDPTQGLPSLEMVGLSIVVRHSSRSIPSANKSISQTDYRAEGMDHASGV